MASPLQVFIVTPTALPSITGNALTVERWRLSLEQQGVAVNVVATKGMNPDTLDMEFKRFKPDLLHVHHAFRAAAPLLTPEIESFTDHIPLVVSPGGTDLNVDWFTESGRSIIIHLCAKARALITQSNNLSQLVRDSMPQFADRVVEVPKSFLWFGNDTFDLRGSAHCSTEDILFFMPAGLRPVKGNLEFLLSMEQVLAARPQLRIVFAGSPLDTGYAEKFFQAEKRLGPRVTWIPAIAPSAMRSAFAAADVVVNGSFSEGFSNAVIEAMAAAKPVLASNIPGNRPLLGSNGSPPAGLLFDVTDANDLQNKAFRLIDDASLRKQLGNAGVIRTTKLPTPEMEANNLSRVYRLALETKSREKSS